MSRPVAADRKTIPQLIDEVLVRVDSPENQKKTGPRTYPGFTMGLEEPIAFCTLFGYDANRCLEDAQFNLAQQLRNRLFWIEHLDATLPVGSAVPAWAGGYVE